MGLRRFLRERKKEKKSIVELQVGNYKLLADSKHPIEGYLGHFKYYSRNLPRIAKYIESKYTEYSIIDVGANIGDTVALLRSAQVNQLVYLIEGEPSYFNLLKKNIQQFDKVKPFETFLGEDNSIQQGGFQSDEGTAKLNLQTSGQLNIRKLDDLAAENGFVNIKLIKVDTDGFDFKILRGSFEIIKQQKPILFFEYDAVYLEEQGEHGTDTLNKLLDLGYSKIIYYDNFGKMLLSTTLDNQLLLDQLYIYIGKKDSAFPYFDVCVFHKDDDGLADEVIVNEMKFYNN